MVGTPYYGNKGTVSPLLCSTLCCPTQETLRLRDCPPSRSPNRPLWTLSFPLFRPGPFSSGLVLRLDSFRHGLSLETSFMTENLLRRPTTFTRNIVEEVVSNRSPVEFLSYWNRVFDSVWDFLDCRPLTVHWCEESRPVAQERTVP